MAVLAVGPGWAQPAPAPPPAGGAAAPAKATAGEAAPGGAAKAEPPAPAVDGQGRPLVTNVWFETDLRQVLTDVGTQTKTVIVPDETVQGTVSIELKDMPLEQALDLILLRGGYIHELIAPGVYLVTTTDPKSPNFPRIARTETVELNYLKGDEVKAQLPEAYAQYVRFADPATRLIVTAPSFLLPKVIAAVQALDKPLTQVLIEALVVESAAGSFSDFSISAQSKRIGVNTETGIATYVDQAAAVLYRVLYLVGQSKGEIKATPRVITQQGRKASVRVALQQYFSLVSGRLGFEYVTLQAVESGVGLSVTPQVAMPERLITCTVEPEVGDVTGTSGQALPIITKRTATTTVRVADGQVIAIGGLLQAVDREIRTKIPILGDIPLLGELFRSKHTTRDQREVTIFIVPHILDEQGKFAGPLLADRVREEQQAKGKPKAVTPRMEPNGELPGPQQPMTPAPAW